MVSYSSIPVLLDSNFLISCILFKIRIENIHELVDFKHKIVIPENVLEELRNLNIKGEERISRDLALKIVERYEVIKLEGEVDSSILDFAEKNRCVVCTNDRELKKKLKKIGVPVIFIRGKSHLQKD